MIFFGVSNPVGAQGGNRAGLVIRYGDGSVSTHCVRFDEAEISGFDLLLRSGLDVVYSSSGVGAMICKIGSEGCDNPGNCLCQCRGANCMYWSYWRQVDGAWQYSSVGASLSRVKPGAVEGWTWGVGTIDAAPEPPLISFDQVCRPATATPTPTPTATPTASPTPTIVLTRTPSPVTSTAAAAPSPSPPATPTLSPSSTPTTLPLPTSTATSLPGPAPTQTPPSTPPPNGPAAEYWGFGVLLVLLLGAGWLALRRRAA